MHLRRLIPVLATCVAIIVPAAHAQIALSTTSPTTENFNSIGTSATAALPANFRADKVTQVRTVGTFAAAATATALRGGDNLSTSASNGIYNFGSGDPTTATDRAIGFLSSSGGTTSGNLYAFYANNTGAAFSGLTISYDIEKYRNGSNTAGFRVQLFYSFDGTAWTAAPSAFNTAFGADANNNGFTPSPGVTQPVTAQTLTVNIPASSNFYLAWNYSVATGTTVTNSQALAIDNVSVQAIAGPAFPTLSINDVSAQEGDSGSQLFNFVVSLSSAAPAGGVSFSIATQDGTATVADSDYVQSSANVTIPQGGTSFTFPVSVNGDNNIEPNETFFVNVTNVTTGVIVAKSKGTGTIVNDDTSTPPTGMGIATPASLSAGDTTTLSVTVVPGTKPTSTGITVTGNLSPIGGSPTQAFNGSGNTFTFDAQVTPDTTAGVKTLGITISDSQTRSSTTSISVTVQTPPAPANHIVISQIYGGGGNSGATFTNDFVELYNPTANPQDLAGWTIQYASATGTSWTNNQPLAGIIGAGEYFLISLASGGSVGSPLPVQANIIGSINMSATAGKVALVHRGTPLTTCSDADIVDFVGYGTSANCREGANAGDNTAAPSNSSAIFRKDGGKTDTNNNHNDFFVSAPNPRRTAPIVEVGPFVVSTDPGFNDSGNPHDTSITVNFSEAVDAVGQWYDITCGSGSHNDATTAHTNDFKTWVITPNTIFNFGETCSVRIFQNAVHDQDLDDSAPNTDTLPSDYVWSFTVVGAGLSAPYASSVHLLMGNPTNAMASLATPNNYLMEKPTYSLSYNKTLGRPNWVSWHLDNSWYGSLARNDTFRPDPSVLPDWYRVQAFDFFTTGFDRGHMTPNADRDNPNRVPINQETYLMSNMVAQSPDNNQGPWANLENYLRTLTNAGQEIYIVAGPAGMGGTGSSGFMNTIANGHVTVPAYTWKAALVLPNPHSDSDVARVTAATRTIAVIMPNIQGIRSSPNNPSDWQNYLTTVDAIEQLCVCDLYSNVPQAIQNSIEAGTNGANPPGVEGQSQSFNEDVAAALNLHDPASPDPNATFTYIIATPPSHGTLSGAAPALTYTPAPDFNGNDTFTWRVNDGHALSNTATVNISVLEVNDAPTANADQKSTNEDTPLTFSASDLLANDSAGPANESNQTLTVMNVSATPDTHGAVQLTGGQITYTPAPDYNGLASFTYTIQDNGFTAGLSDPKSANGTVNVNVIPVNDPPVLTDVPSIATIPELAAYTFTAHAADIDSPTLTFSLINAPDGAAIDAATGKFSWTPTEAQGGTQGPFTFTVRVSDGSLNADASISIGVTEVNQPPDLAPIDSKTVFLGDTLNFKAVASDVDIPVQTISYSLDATAPPGSSIDPATGAFAWTPTGDQAGLTFTFDVIASDGVASTPVPVTVNVVDKTPPVMSALTFSETRLWPPNHQMVNVTVDYTVFDLGDPNPGCVLSVTSNEPVNGLGDGDQTPDWNVIDWHHIQLRAERAAKGNGRIYTVLSDCRDRFGNASQKSATVSVPKDNSGK